MSYKQFQRDTLEELFDVARYLKKVVDDPDKGETSDLKGKYIATCFFEPSTRTTTSFHSAMLRLGGKVLGLNTSVSSAAKGETLSDTVKVLQNYVDCIVLRHAGQGSAQEAADAASIPIINAGDGANEHPTQALLDMFCIHEEFGKLENITVTLLGDLKYGRTVRSMAPLMAQYGIKLNLVSPPVLKMDPAHVQVVRDMGGHVHETNDLESVISSTDVLYCTRVQKERFPTEEDYLKVKGSYVIDPAFMARAPKHMLVLHPLPRVDEISPAVDCDPRSMYFKEPRYGMIMRMALLLSVLRR